MDNIVDERQRAKTAMEPQVLNTMQVNPMKRKKGMFFVACHARGRLQRLRGPHTTSPTGLAGSGVSIAFEAVR